MVVSNPARTRATNGQLTGSMTHHIKWLCPLRGKTRRAPFHMLPRKVRPLPSTSPPFTLSTVKPEGSVFCLGQPTSEREQRTRSCLLPWHVISGGIKGKQEYCLEVRWFGPQQGSDEPPQDFRAPGLILIRSSKVGPSEGLQNGPRAQSQG